MIRGRRIISVTCGKGGKLQGQTSQCFKCRQMFCLHEKCRLIYDGAVHPELQLMELQRTRVGTESRIRTITSNVSLIDSYENKRLFRAPSSYTVPISFLEQVLQARKWEINLEQLQKSHSHPFFLTHLRTMDCWRFLQTVRDSPINMWHMTTSRQLAMNDITASDCRVPLRETMQSLWREEQWLSAWKNWAPALK